MHACQGHLFIPAGFKADGGQSDFFSAPIKQLAVALTDHGMGTGLEFGIAGKSFQQFLFQRLQMGSRKKTDLKVFIWRNEGVLDRRSQVCFCAED